MSTDVVVLGLGRMVGKDDEKDWPDVDEIITATIIEIVKYGCAITLHDYETKKGFIHISEISTTWVGKIEDFVRIGQVVKAIVIEVESQKGVIFCSLKRVPVSPDDLFYTR